MMELLRAVTVTVFKSNLLHVNDNGVKGPKSITELIIINVDDHKIANRYWLLEASPVEKKFRQNCLQVSSIVHPSEIQAAIGVNYVEEWYLSLPLKEGRQGKFECHFKSHHRII